MSLILLLALLFLSAILYFPLNIRKPKYFWEIIIDKYIPFIPPLIIPYLTLYLFITVSFILLWPKIIFESFVVALLVVNLSAAIFWYRFPNGVKRPVVKGKSWLLSLVRLAYNHDKEGNAFPSAHVYYSTVCAIYLWQAFPQIGWPVIVWGGTISISTVFVKQHYLIDILGGLFWAFTARFLAKFLTGM